MVWHLPDAASARSSSYASQGLEQRDMAESLSISRLTVECHTKNIYRKLAVNLRAPKPSFRREGMACCADGRTAPPALRPARPSPSATAAPALHVEAVRGTGWNDTAPPAEGWAPVTLPDSWATRWPGFDGVVWYRLTWQEPEQARNRPAAALPQHGRRGVAQRHADLARRQPGRAAHARLEHTAPLAAGAAAAQTRHQHAAGARIGPVRLSAGPGPVEPGARRLRCRRVRAGAPRAPRPAGAGPRR